MYKLFFVTKITFKSICFSEKPLSILNYIFLYIYNVKYKKIMTAAVINNNVDKYIANYLAVSVISTYL